MSTSSPPPPAIHATGLSKRFGDVVALDGLDLSVPQGSVLGLLGPNGAGKTTAVSILTTLLPADAGHGCVAGADLRTEPALVRARIGLSGQFAAVDDVLTGRENLVMIGELYGMGRRRAKRRAADLLGRLDLSEAADRPVKGYSGGMRRRLDLAGALVAEPPVLFLDEPTTGLDPRSRLGLWDVIRELVDGGATLLLTTQYLEEADRLADDIIVIDRGRAIARGTADELKQDLGGERIEATVAPTADLDAVEEVLAAFADGVVEVQSSSRTLLAPVNRGVDSLGDVIAELRARELAVTDIGLRRPTLDDVFLTLTGRHAEHDTTSATDEGAPTPAEVSA